MQRRQSLNDMNCPLYLCRHGEAGFAATDAERPLTENGRAHVRTVAERFAAVNDPRGLKIIASPLLRAQQTAEIWAEVLGGGITIHKDHGVVPEGNVISFTRRLAEQECPWLVASHFPFVPTMASFLLTGQKDRVRLSVPTGTIIALQPEGEPGRAGAYSLLGMDS